MARIPADIQELFNRTPIAVLATADSNGLPNAVPVGAKKIIDDETILISDQFMLKTAANLIENPQVSVSFWEGGTGCQVKGTAEIITQGALFEETARWIEEIDAMKKRPFHLVCKGVVIIKVSAVYSTSSGPQAGRQLA